MELDSFWKQTVDRLKMKMEHWVRQQCPDKNEIHDKYKDVLISDKELSEKFGDTDPGVLVYGGIDVTENMRHYLRLPSKLKLYGRFKITDEEVRAEAETVKARWDKRERDERSEPGESW